MLDISFLDILNTIGALEDLHTIFKSKGTDALKEEYLVRLKTEKKVLHDIARQYLTDFVKLYELATQLQEAFNIDPQDLKIFQQLSENRQAQIKLILRIELIQRYAELSKYLQELFKVCEDAKALLHAEKNKEDESPDTSDDDKKAIAEAVAELNEGITDVESYIGDTAYGREHKARQTAVQKQEETSISLDALEKKLTQLQTNLLELKIDQKSDLGKRYLPACQLIANIDQELQTGDVELTELADLRQESYEFRAATKELILSQIEKCNKLKVENPDSIVILSRINVVLLQYTSQLSKAPDTELGTFVTRFRAFISEFAIYPYELVASFSGRFDDIVSALREHRLSQAVQQEEEKALTVIKDCGVAMSVCHSIEQGLGDELKKFQANPYVVALKQVGLSSEQATVSVVRRQLLDMQDYLAEPMQLLTRREMTVREVGKHFSRLFAVLASENTRVEIAAMSELADSLGASIKKINVQAKLRTVLFEIARCKQKLPNGKHSYSPNCGYKAALKFMKGEIEGKITDCHDPAKERKFMSDLLINTWEATLTVPNKALPACMVEFFQQDFVTRYRRPEEIKENSIALIFRERTFTALNDALSSCPANGIKFLPLMKPNNNHTVRDILQNLKEKLNKLSKGKIEQPKEQTKPRIYVNKELMAMYAIQEAYENITKLGEPVSQAVQDFFKTYLTDVSKLQLVPQPAAVAEGPALQN